MMLLYILHYYETRVRLEPWVDHRAKARGWTRGKKEVWLVNEVSRKMISREHDVLAIRECA